VPAQGDPFTADADIMAGWAGGSGVTAMVSSAFMVSLLALLVSAILFLRGYTRGHRALTGSLIGSTVAMVLTPAIQSISGWLLD
jgi:membrane-bound metal-dependent hydrolase YbcI (DUF457 family)